MGPESELHNIAREAIVETIRRAFPGGIMPSSIIDRKKFARLCLESIPFPFPVNYEDEAALAALCQAECIAVGKKFYALSAAALDRVDEILDRLYSAGCNSIYFDKLYNHHAQELLNLGIGSPLILAACVNRRFACDSDFFSFDDIENITAEAGRAVNGEAIITQELLEKRLPFHPLASCLSSPARHWPVPGPKKCPAHPPKRPGI